MGQEKGIWGRHTETRSELKIELPDEGVVSLSQAGPGDPLQVHLSLHWS